MEKAETILVIYLSAALFIFLVLGIILLIKAIQLANKFNRLANKAEQAVEAAQAVAGSFAAGRFISRVVEFASRFKESKNGGKGK